jgi:cell filamentation protein
MTAARERGESAKAITSLGEATRKTIAGKIRSGEPLDPKAPEFAGKGPATIAPPTRDRSR